MPKIVAISQSGYLPWKGYFDIISRVDEYIILDEVQYPKETFCNRNHIKTPEGLQYLTVPVVTKGRAEQKISEAQVADAKWAHKHWSTIQNNYARSEFFGLYKDRFAEVYDKAAALQNLSAINESFLRLLCGILGINTKLTQSSEYELAEGKNEKVVGLLKQSGAGIYLARPGSREYMQAAPALYEGIKIVYMDYAGYPEYKQQNGEFVHNLSVIDLIFNMGPESPKYLNSRFKLAVE